MAQVHDTVGATHNTRRVPNAHSDAVQEAKRQEKMQSHSSSHRTSGAASGPNVQSKDAAS